MHVTTSSCRTIFLLSLAMLTFDFQVEESSPTLLFLHGFLGTGHDWLPIMRALSSSFRCIAVDLPGHGLTKVNSQHGTTGDFSISMKVVSDALVKLHDNLGLVNVVPIGYSMGARIALYLSLCHSTKVSLLMRSPGCYFPFCCCSFEKM